MHLRVRRLRRTLAVSTVVGTVLMTTLAITLGTIVVFWASQTFGNYQNSASVYFNNRAAALRESLAMEDVWFYSAGSSCAGSGTKSCINLTVRNTGTTELKVVAFYINGTSKTPLSVTLPYTIEVGKSKTFTFLYNTSAWGSTTKVYFIQVATARGNQVNTHWSYP
jgi:hypothetical protein